MLTDQRSSGSPRWEIGPYGFVGLWDMLAKYAWQFFVLSGLLEGVKRRIGLTTLSPYLPQTGPSNALAAGIVPTLPYQSIAGSPPPALNDEIREDVRRLLELIKGVCESIEILSVSPEIDRIIAELPYPMEGARAQFHIEHLSARIADELNGQEFLHVPRNKRDYFMKLELFGPKVTKKFAKVSADIQSAGNCYALNQNTACVFHLMRVMEHCVQRLGKKLKVPINPQRESWHEIMSHVNGAVNKMPGGASATKAQNARKKNMR